MDSVYCAVSIYYFYVWLLGFVQQKSNGN